MSRSSRVEGTSSPRVLTRGFVALLLTQTCFSFGFSSFFLLPKFLASELHASASEIGNVIGVFGVAVVILILLIGIWIDRGSRVRFLTGGNLLMAGVCLGFTQVETVGPLLFALRIVQGAAFALVFLAASTLTADHAPPERLGRALGLFGASNLVMNALAPAIVEPLAESVGWTPVFLLAAASSLAAAALSRSIPERRIPPGPDEVVPRLSQVLRSEGVVRLALAVALVGVTFGAIFTFHQPFALELGIPRIRSFFLAYAGVALLARLLLAGLADRVDSAHISIFVLIAYSASALWMAHLEAGRLAWIGALFGLAHGLFYPAMNSLLLRGSGEHERGKRMGIFNGSFNAGLSLGIIGLGFLAERTGYPTVFVVAAGGSMVALGLLLTRSASATRPPL